ncbi:MAG: hypothetical protein LBU65_00490 [Planctomycetaceae bacterium]|jgi:hypothetical protein|nr:hypothetical protein [Planctomycetaceae bacterium]
MYNFSLRTIICFITILVVFIAGIFIRKGFAESDGLIFEQQISKVGELIEAQKYNDVSRLVARIEKTAENGNGDNFITYVWKFVFSAQGYGHKDDKVVSMCKKLSSKAIVVSTNLPARIGQQIDLLEWERKILQKDDETAYLLIKERKE